MEFIFAVINALSSGSGPFVAAWRFNLASILSSLIFGGDDLYLAIFFSFLLLNDCFCN